MHRHVCLAEKNTTPGSIGPRATTLGLNEVLGMVSFGSRTSQNTFSVEGLPVDVQTCSECLLSVVFNEGIVTMVPAVIVQVFKTGVGMCGVNVSSHKRKGPNDAIAHHTPTLTL